MFDSFNIHFDDAECPSIVRRKASASYRVGPSPPTSLRQSEEITHPQCLRNWIFARACKPRSGRRLKLRYIRALGYLRAPLKIPVGLCAPAFRNYRNCATPVAVGHNCGRLQVRGFMAPTGEALRQFPEPWDVEGVDFDANIA